jgi:hypothetical protein
LSASVGLFSAAPKALLIAMTQVKTTPKMAIARFMIASLQMELALSNGCKIEVLKMKDGD